MTKEKLKLIAFGMLEESLQESVGEDFNPDKDYRILTICMGESCKRIGIPIRRRKYWMHRDQNPELYDRAISHYGQLNKQEKGGLSHGHCFPCGEDLQRKTDKFIESLQ